MGDYVKIGRYEGEYFVVYLPAHTQDPGVGLPPKTFRDKAALMAFLQQTLHIPYSCIAHALRRGDSIRVSPEQVGRWPR